MSPRREKIRQDWVLVRRSSPPCRSATSANASAAPRGSPVRYSFRTGSELVDAPGRRVVGAKREYRFVRLIGLQPRPRRHDPRGPAGRRAALRLSYRHALLALRAFWHTAWLTPPGALPRRIDTLLDDLSLFVLPEQVAHPPVVSLVARAVIAHVPTSHRRRASPVTCRSVRRRALYHRGRRGRGGGGGRRRLGGRRRRGRGARRGRSRGPCRRCRRSRCRRG